MIDFILTIDKGVLSIFSHLGAIFILDQLMIFFTIIGKIGAVWILITFMMLITKKYRKAGIITAIALLFSLLLVNVTVKPLVQRPRPFNEHKEITLKIKPPAEEYSFPSGHASSSFAAAIAISLTLGKKRLSLIVLVLAAIITFSRIYLNVHYTSDVIGGMAAGFLCAVGAWLLGKKIITLLPGALFGGNESEGQ